MDFANLKKNPPPSKSKRNSNCFTGFYHHAYLEGAARRKNTTRSRSASPVLPPIPYLSKKSTNNISPRLKFPSKLQMNQLDKKPPIHFSRSTSPINFHNQEEKTLAKKQFISESSLNEKNIMGEDTMQKFGAPTAQEEHIGEMQKSVTICGVAQIGTKNSRGVLDSPVPKQAQNSPGLPGSKYNVIPKPQHVKSSKFGEKVQKLRPIFDPSLLQPQENTTHLKEAKVDELENDNKPDQNTQFKDQRGQNTQVKNINTELPHQEQKPHLEEKTAKNTNAKDFVNPQGQKLQVLKKLSENVFFNKSPPENILIINERLYKCYGLQPVTSESLANVLDKQSPNNMGATVRGYQEFGCFSKTSLERPSTASIDSSKPEIKNGGFANSKRPFSVPRRGRFVKNPGNMEMCNPNFEITEGSNYSLIETIKAKIFPTNEKETLNNIQNRGANLKFPKETRNAMIVMMNSVKSSPLMSSYDSKGFKKEIVKQSCPKLSVFKNCGQIPCPKNLLCEKGLHPGKCGKSERNFLTCSTQCACGRKTSFGAEEIDIIQ